MASEINKRDQNHVTVLSGITDDSNQFITMLRVDPTSKRLLVSATGASAGVTSFNGLTGAVTISAGANVTFSTNGNNIEISSSGGGGGGSGTVTTVSVVTANGVSGSVATASTTPAITLTLGAITPTSVNGLTITSTTGTLTITAAKTLAVTNTLTLSGTDGTVMTFPSTSATVARTDAANTFTGASTASAWVLTSPTITTKISPTTDDGAPLGDTTHNFSDLFLASGAVINYANSNVVITHTSGILTMGTGDFRVSTAGTNAASVVTVGGTQTLTNKTLTTPVIASISNSGTITIPTGTLTLATLTGTEELTNKTLTTSVGKGTWTASGTWTLPAFTLGGVVTMGENSEILLDAALSADGKYCGITEDGTAGETLSFGHSVYLKTSDSRWYQTDADADATAGAVKVGMCVLAAAGAASATKILLYGKIRADAQFPTFTIGAPVYLSTTTGALQVAQPSGTDDVIRIIGYGNTGDELFFNPSNDYLTHT